MEPIKKLVKQATTQIERERDAFAHSLGITGGQMSVIDFLANQPGHASRQRAIEHEFGIKRSTTTIMVQRMEKRQLIERVSAPTDKRQKLVKLLPAAEKLIPKIRTYMVNDDQKLRAHFTDDELAIVERVLTFIRKGTKNGSR